MKILLIRPNSSILQAPPPMGHMYLVSYLRKARPGKDVVLVHDARGEQTSDSGVGEIIQEFQPDFVGITSLTMEAETTHIYGALAKKHAPGCTTVIGGPYGSADSAIALQDDNIDFTARGEGEVTLVKLLESLENGSGTSEIKGIGYRKNGGVVAATFPELIQDLDEIPYPAWDALDIERYFGFGKVRHLNNPIQTRPRGMSIITTRGCPYQCTYCHNLFGKKLRMRSVANVLGEIRKLVEDYRIGEIEFIDDLFNMDRTRSKEICDGIIEAGWDLRISFPNALRADQMDEELVEKMKVAGVYRIIYAVESGTPRIQKMIKKNVNLIKAKKIIDYTAEKGIFTGGFFMLGFRDETEEEAWNTINYALTSKLHTASFFIVTPYPNTEMYDEALEMGYDMDTQYHDLVTLSTNLSRIGNKRLEQLRRIAYRKFYLNPRRVLSILIAVPSMRTLFRNFFRAARAGIIGKELNVEDKKEENGTRSNGIKVQKPDTEYSTSNQAKEGNRDNYQNSDIATENTE